MADILETFDQKQYSDSNGGFEGILLSHKKDPNSYLKVERFFDEHDFLGINWSTTMGAKVIEPLLGEYYGDSYRVSPIELSDEGLQLPQDRAKANQVLQTTIRFGVDGGEDLVDESINYFIWRIHNERTHNVGALVTGLVIPEAIHEIMQKTVRSPITTADIQPLLQQVSDTLHLG